LARLVWAKAVTAAEDAKKQLDSRDTGEKKLVTG
jgi:hypothetical protein